MTKLTLRFIRELKTHLDSTEDLENFCEEEDDFYPVFERRKKKTGRNEYNDE